MRREDVIQRLCVKKGETLVITSPDKLSREQAAKMKAIAMEALPTGVRVLILSGGVKLSVVSTEAADGNRNTEETGAAA